MSRYTWIAVAFATALLIAALKLAGPAPLAANLASPEPDASTETPTQQAAPLNQTIDTAHFRIEYTNDFTNFPRDAISDAQAALLGDDLETGWDIYVNQYGFREPHYSIVAGKTLIEVHSFEGPQGLSHGGWIELGPSYVRATGTITPFSAPIHELFHEIQRAYAPTNAPWVDEGLAELMPESALSALDNDPDSEYLFWIGLLFDFPDLMYFDDAGIQQGGLMANTYKTAVFWKYFAEQIGTSPGSISDPGYHIDAVRHFYENYLRYGATGAVEQTMADLGKPMSFEDLFRNFALTLYTKDLSYTDQFAFKDDDVIPYEPVYRVVTTVSTLGNPAVNSFTNESFLTWSSRYYQLNVGGGCNYLQVTITPTNGTAPFFHLVSVKNNTVQTVQTVTSNNVNRTFYAGSGNILDSVGVVAGSTSEAVTYTLTSRCVTPSLSIKSPTVSNVAYAGDPANPETFLIELSVTADGTAVAGLDPSAFTVTVGGLPASIVSAASVQDQYWLVVQPPAQPVSTTYDLSVGLYNGPSATSLNAVRYLPRPTADQLLVIDNSGSMADESKIDAVRSAAQLYIDVSAADDKIGVITYSNVASTTLPLVPANALGKLLANLATGLMQPYGNTCIGCGAQAAQNELNAHGDPSHFWNIVLLSDGMQNTGSTWNDVRGAITPTQTVIDTVFVGPADDEAELLMQRIAKETDGRYNRVFLDSEGINTSSARTLSAPSRPLEMSLPNRMANTFKTSREHAENQYRFFEGTGFISSAGVEVTQTMTVEQGMSEFVLGVNWNYASINPSLRRPDGTTVNPGDPDVESIAAATSNKTYRIVNPVPGIWTISLVSQGDSEFFVAASARTPTKLYAINALPEAQRIVGNPVPILAVLADSRPITGARVLASFQGPDGAYKLTLRMRDDGQHGDGLANDGVYGIEYPLTNLKGSYSVKIFAEGINNSGQAFTRIDRLGFYLFGGPDTDQDGLPDLWELRWGLHPFQGQDLDTLGDLDDDGLDNYHEFLLGTNPRSSDTDGGGENDGSEAHRHSNPFDPEDDALRAPRWLWAHGNNGSVTLVFDPPPLPPGAGIIYRYAPQAGAASVGTLGWGDPVSFTVSATTIFTDTSIQNGVNYRYEMVWVDGNGNRSRSSPPAEAKPNQFASAPSLDEPILEHHYLVPIVPQRTQ